MKVYVFNLVYEIFLFVKILIFINLIILKGDKYLKY